MNENKEALTKNKMIKKLKEAILELLDVFLGGSDECDIDEFSFLAIRIQMIAAIIHVIVAIILVLIMIFLVMF